MSETSTAPEATTLTTPQEPAACFSQSSSDAKITPKPLEKQNERIHSKSPRRVKVYLLQGDDWLDNGTGFCMGEVDRESQRPYFIVRNELDDKDVLLQSFLEGSIQYQRQQETLIVWTDLAGKDLALSFQENEGCADLCDFIIRAQQENLSPQISLYYVLTSINGSAHNSASNGDTPREITELITGPVSFPPLNPTRDNLKEILETITQGCNSMYSRFKMSAFLVESHYFDRLYRLFAQMEKSRDLTGLHLLSDTIKVVLYYNESALVEELVSSEERVLGLVGILEYDRDYPGYKACHREYLLDESRLKMVIDIPLPRTGLENEQMDIFKKDFVLQYLKNVVLPLKSDESALSLLGSMIHSNQGEIIDFLKDSSANGNFLQRLFDMYDAQHLSSTSSAFLTVKKHDGVRLLHQYVVSAKSNAGHSGDFFGALVKHGLLRLIKYALAENDTSLRVLGMEILTTVIDQDVALVNLVSNENKEVDELEDMGEPKKETIDDHQCDSIKMDLMHDMSLPLILGQLLLEDKSSALKLQTFEALKSLLCPTVFDGEGKEEMGEFDDEHDACVKKYFESFYEQVAPTLFRTFIDLASGIEEKIAGAKDQLRTDPGLFQHLCDLISFCCHEHEASICRPFFTKSHTLEGIVKVLEIDVNVTLKLAVLRCFKSLILLDDHAFCSYMVDRDLFAPFFAYFDAVATEDSLPNSSCLDLLEVLTKRSSGGTFACLVLHVSTHYYSFLKTSIDYVSTGRDLLAAANKIKDRTKDFTATSVDVDPEFLRDPQPSSPISQGENGWKLSANGEKDENGNGNKKVENGKANGSVENNDHDDSLTKRKSESGVEGMAEKCTRMLERDSRCQEESGLEESASTGAREVSTQP